ncbi:MAG: thermonuclease family protein [Solirubrobacterales bacterium]
MSRRNRAVLIGISLIGTALVVLLDRNLVAPRWSDLLSPRDRTLGTDVERYGGKSFPVVRVVDGDTLHLGVADTSGDVTKVRLIGIDAPEMGSGERERMYYAQEATEAAKRMALGKSVTVYLDRQAGSRDRYQRLLAYIQLPDGRFLNEELLSQGFAYADLRFKHGYYQKYLQLEAGARSLKEGLWAHVTIDQMPQWRQKRLQTGENED